MLEQGVFPPQGIFPDPVTEPSSPTSSALQARFFTTRYISKQQSLWHSLWWRQTRKASHVSCECRKE